ncbi:ornithine cyclodeaminase family protein [Pseudoalteromonas fenneropenaei]|uniref:Ornithine cyclodeaminase family protein n=1 Tax=Pseudoalteromonas fenneropenaei TaxID=1737459 RepID=A0ABV7CFP8_9GAMM
MQIITASQVHQHLAFPTVLNKLAQGFAAPATMPQRQIFELDSNPHNHDAFAVLPAWNDEVIGVKSFTYFPDNEASGYASLYSKIMLFSRAHGEPLALVDGTSVTLWRTAAVSALAASLLAKPNAKHLVLFGSGKLAPFLIRAHLAVRQYTQVTLVARNHAKAAAVITILANEFSGVEFAYVDQADEALISSADVICCATGARSPLFNGAWLTPGCHVDLLGNHHKESRECDTTTIIRASVYVDSRTNVLNEAGELLIPIKEGVFSAAQVKAELADMCRQAPNRSADEITVFKSVGTALADLLTAHLVLTLCQQQDKAEAAACLA